MNKYQSVKKLIPFSRSFISYSLLAGVFFLISFLSIFLIYKFTSIDQLRIPTHLVSSSVIISLICLLVCYFLTDGLRLYFVIRALNSHIELKEIVKLVFINIFISNITPLASGGGFVQIYFLTKKGMPAGKSMAASTVRTVLAMMFLFVFAPFVVLYQNNLYTFINSTYIFSSIILIVAGYFLLFYCIILKPRIIKKAIYYIILLFQNLNFISAKNKKKVVQKLFREIDSCSRSLMLLFSGQTKYILLAIIFTILFLLTLFSFSVLFILGMGYKMNVITILALQLFITFLMYFAPTPGASGVAEGSYALIFSRFINTNDIALLTLLWRLFTIYLGVVVGILVTYWEIFLYSKDK